MAVEIYEDLVNGHMYYEDDRAGYLTRVFVITGLASGSGITGEALRAADRAKMIPSAGQTHPTLPEFRVRDMVMKPFAERSRDSLRAEVRYVKNRRRLLDVRVGQVSNTQESYIDRYGKRMRVGYKAPTYTSDSAPKLIPVPQSNRHPDYSADAETKGWRYSVTSLPKQTPELLLEIVYLEKGSPVVNNLKYARRLNSKEFQGTKPRTWYCESITGTIDSPIPTNLGSLGNPQVVVGPALFDWVTTYTFRYRPLPTEMADSEGWDPTAAFVDINSGLTPTDVDPIVGGWPKSDRGNGWRQFELYGDADFNELNVTSGIEIDPRLYSR